MLYVCDYKSQLYNDIADTHRIFLPYLFLCNALQTLPHKQQKSTGEKTPPVFVSFVSAG